MKFIDEAAFLDVVRPCGIEQTENQRSLRFHDEDAVRGFDFTNLSAPDTGAVPIETMGAGDRSVEYAMVSTLFKLVEKLDLFPIYLYAADNEWADDDLEALAARTFLTPAESELFGEIMERDHGMDVIVIGRDDIVDAVRILTPQITVFSTQCCACDERGRFLATFSQDDEVSFNTTDPERYRQAAALLKEMNGLPFEIVWVEDYA